MKSHKELLVWQKSVDLAEAIYRITELFPKHQQYSLCQQMQKAAVSISSNIAEGSGRNSTKEFLHFLSISYGSMAELETQIIIAQRLQFISIHEYEPLLAQIQEIGKMLNGLQASVRKNLTDHRPLTTDH